MAQNITIDPVTRIEGHAKVTVYLDDAGQVTNAQLNVNEFRGFEKFCEGRPFFEMPGITARICGICPISHQLASAKAGDAILGVDIPEAAIKLRRLMNFGQFIQSHALSFFHLSSPDFLLGFDSDPAQRNVMGLIAAKPDIATDGVLLRKYGQDIIDCMGGKRIHPPWAVPGGVREPLTAQIRDHIRAGIPDALARARRAIDLFKTVLDSHAEEARAFGNFPSMFMGLVTAEGNWEIYDGDLRIVDSVGHTVVDRFDPADYQEYIGEAVEPWSWLKFPYYLPMGYPAGLYRVGPLARVNIAARMGSPLADQEQAEFRTYGRGCVLSSFFYHYARLIELLASVEQVQMLMDDPDLVSPRVRADAGLNKRRGVGVHEAPRGTLLHDYRVDADGIIRGVNLIVSTGHNNLAMNRTITQIAQHFVATKGVTQGVLNRVEAGIRAYDPCLSCSTHAVGQMPMMLQVRASDGSLVQEIRRD
jgi:NAD-reducing hydrogenase large subunit